MIRELIDDAIELTRSERRVPSLGNVLRTALTSDSYAVLALTRLRQAARRRGVPGVGHLLRLIQTGFYGVEIGKDVELGPGVSLVHTLGTVIGGTSRLGKRVRFMGNNTVGTAKDNGCPVIEDDVIVGCGARILGPVRIGAGAQIGANAVVLSDVPARAVAVGIPAVVRERD
jgi:serine O-acetyltransferase